MRKKSCMNAAGERYIFILYILCFLVAVVTIALYQPHEDTPPLYGNPPDEHARYLVPRYICEYGTIPTGLEEEITMKSYGFSYGLYNVFPYIIQGYFMRFVNIFTNSELLLLYSARSVNILCGILMAVVVYLLSKKLFKDRRFGWLFCFAVMCLPQCVFIHSYVNTESMSLLSTAMIVYAWVSIRQEGYSYRNIIWLSGGIILCALSYYNAYGFILSSILLFLGSFFMNKDGKLSYDWKEMLKKGSVIIVIVLLGAGWWFLRSYLLHDGDFLGIRTREALAEQHANATGNMAYLNTYKNQGISVWQMIQERNFFEGAFLSFIASFGSMAIFGSIWIYRFYRVFIWVGFIGYILELMLQSKDKVTNKLRDNRGNLFFHLNMICCIVIPLILMIIFAYSTDYQNQGRYLLPGIVPMMYYIVMGLERLVNFKWIPKWLKYTGILSICLGILVCLFWMIYGYALPVYIKIGRII